MTESFPAPLQPGYTPATRQRRYRQMNSLMATAFIAVTIIIMAYAALFGPAPIVLLYALWFPQILTKGIGIALPSRDSFIAVAFAGYAIASTGWSDYPNVSLYSSLEYASLLVCTLIIGRIVPFAAWLRGLIIGCVLVLAASLASGNYGIDPMGGAPSLIGWFGSKNQVGFFAEIGIAASLVVLFSRRRRLEKLFFAIGPLPVFLLSLYLSKSASSVVSLCGMLGILVIAALVSHLPRRLRRTALIFSLVTITLLIVIGASLNVQSLILSSFGKDTTLTGRTYLWMEGIKVGQLNPVLGDGYNAFWVVGRPLAERYWYEFMIPTRSGFHFHDLYVQCFVDLGLVGLMLLVMILLTNCARSFGSVIRYGIHAQNSLPLALSFMLLIRSIVEVDLIGSFSIGPVLFYSILPWLHRFKREQEQSSGACTP